MLKRLWRRLVRWLWLSPLKPERPERSEPIEWVPSPRFYAALMEATDN